MLIATMPPLLFVCLYCLALFILHSFSTAVSASFSLVNAPIITTEWSCCGRC